MPKVSKAAVGSTRIAEHAVSRMLATEIASDVSIDGIRFTFDQLWLRLIVAVGDSAKLLRALLERKRA